MDEAVSLTTGGIVPRVAAGLYALARLNHTIGREGGWASGKQTITTEHDRVDAYPRGADGR